MDETRNMDILSILSFIFIYSLLFMNLWNYFWKWKFDYFFKFYLLVDYIFTFFNFIIRLLSFWILSNDSSLLWTYRLWLLYKNLRINKKVTKVLYCIFRFYFNNLDQAFRYKRTMLATIQLYIDKFDILFIECEYSVILLCGLYCEFIRIWKQGE